MKRRTSKKRDRLLFLSLFPFSRKQKSSLSLFLLCLFLLGCRPAVPEKEITRDAGIPAYGDVLVGALVGDASNLVPILASDVSSATITGLVFDGLVKYDKNIELIGDLAESWEVLEDGRVIVFHLRKGVRWHDGHPFTARDVEFTYRKLIDPNVRTPYSGDFERVRVFEALDDYTIKITYKEPFSPALSSWGMSIMPRHLLEGEDLNNTAFSRRPIGTGPYKFREWTSGDRIELAANHDYYEGRPYIDRHIYRIIPDQATMFLELQSQGIDSMSLTPLEYRRQTGSKFFARNFRKFHFPGFGYTYMGFNFSDPKFRDIKVRQAINYAIDKEEIIEGVLLGLGTVSTGPFSPQSWAYNKDVVSVSYDPKKAKELLRDAGWQDTNGDGWLDKQGRIFEFTLLTNQGKEDRKRAAEIIQRRLADVGIRVKIKIVEWSAFINEFIDKRRFEAVLLGWGLSQDPDYFDIWHSTKTKEGEFNFLGYNNPEVDRLLEEGRRVFDREERKAIYHKMHRILYEDQPCIFLYVPDSLPIIHRRFRGIEVAPLGIGYNFIKWYVPRSEQKYIR